MSVEIGLYIRIIVGSDCDWKGIKVNVSCSLGPHLSLSKRKFRFEVHLHR